jgi:hypothetical protein
MQLAIQFHRDGLPTHQFITDLLSFITSNGFRYEREEYPNRFSIIGPEATEEINHVGDDWDGGLEAIIDTYREYDPAKTSVTIYLSRVEKPRVPISVAVIPREQSDGTLVSIAIEDSQVEPNDKFEQLLSLAKSLCIEFCFEFGADTDEYNPSIPESVDELLTEYVGRYVFISGENRSLVDTTSLSEETALQVEALSQRDTLIVISKDGMPSENEIQTFRERVSASI